MAPAHSTEHRPQRFYFSGQSRSPGQALRRGARGVAEALEPDAVGGHLVRPFECRPQKPAASLPRKPKEVDSSLCHGPMVKRPLEACLLGIVVVLTIQMGGWFFTGSNGFLLVFPLKPPKGYHHLLTIGRELPCEPSLAAQVLGILVHRGWEWASHLERSADNMIGTNRNAEPTSLVQAYMVLTSRLQLASHDNMCVLELMSQNPLRVTACWFVGCSRQRGQIQSTRGKQGHNYLPIFTYTCVLGPKT